MIPTITTFRWVPEFARGFVRDMRPRWAFEEVGQPYAVDLITDSKCPEHRRFQPFGQRREIPGQQLVDGPAGVGEQRVPGVLAQFVELEDPPRHAVGHHRGVHPVLG